VNENRIYVSGDGSHSIISGRFGESYHSRFGAIQESKHVFIKQGLLYRSKSIDSIRILEFGFGTGLNAALTWQFALAHPEKTIYYSGLENYPISVSMAVKLNYPTLLGLPNFISLHESQWGQEEKISTNFYFAKSKRDFGDVHSDSSYDLIYYDPFAPDCQPELWKPNMLKLVLKVMARSGIFVTYCAKGAFRRALLEVGFDVEKLPGPPGKREMLRATRA